MVLSTHIMQEVANLCDDVIVIVDNQSASPVTGTFAGLPEGAFVVGAGSLGAVGVVVGNRATAGGCGWGGQFAHGAFIGEDDFGVLLSPPQNLPLRSPAGLMVRRFRAPRRPIRQPV